MKRRAAVGALASLVVTLLQACSAPGGAPGGQSALTIKKPSLGEVQSAIRNSGVKWTAAAPSRRYELGVPLNRLPPVHLVIPEDTNANLPSSFDWRNNNGTNYVSPVLDQGRCGSCVAFATIATFETQLNIAAGDSSSPYQLSPQYLFSCGGGACSFGWDNDSAAQFLTSTGVPDDACMPYASGPNGDDAQCNAACGDVSKRALVASSYSTPTTGSTSLTALKTALMQGPLATDLTVYEDFFFYKSGVYKHVTGQVAGGHSVSIVGWSDVDQAWICRNSWGPDWGMGGFFEIAYTDISGVGQQTWGFTVPKPGPYVSITGVRDGALFSGKSQALAFDVQSLTNANVTWTLTQGGKVATQGAAGNTSQGVIDTTTVADGVYTLQASATAGGGVTVSSEPRVVSVLNGTETGSIQITGLSAGQTVSGVLTVNLTATYAPIPFTQIKFSIADSSGTVVKTHSTGNVGPTMNFGWDTTRYANGNYTLSVIGVAGTQSTQTATATVTIKN